MSLLDNTEIKEVRSLDLLAKQVVEGFIIGLHKSPFHGFSVEFAEHRLYNSGESTKNIDWKVYARTDKLFVKKYEEETNLRCQIVIDTSSSMFFPFDSNNNKLYFSSLAAAALMNLLQRQRDAFGLSLFNESVTFHSNCKNSTKHYRYLLSELDKNLNEKSIDIKSGAIDALHQIADSIHKRSLVIIFSDMFENVDSKRDIFSALQHLKHNKHEVVLFHVTDKSYEVDFDFDNKPHLFIDAETGEKLKVQPSQVKNSYNNKMKEFKTNLVEKCLQYHIDFIDVDINEGFNNVLESYLVKRKKMKI